MDPRICGCYGQYFYLYNTEQYGTSGVDLPILVKKLAEKQQMQ